MKQSIKALALISIVVALQGCAALSLDSSFRTVERNAIAAGLSVGPEEVTVLSRCQYAVIKAGEPLNAPFETGICAASKDALSLRVVDLATKTSRPDKLLAFKEIDSISYYTGLGTHQVLVRKDGETYAIVTRPDGQVGFNNEYAKQLFAHLKSAGLKVVETLAGNSFGGR